MGKIFDPFFTTKRGQGGKGKGLTFLSAYSGREAEQFMQTYPDIALILLDVIMETDDAGLSPSGYNRFSPARN